MSFANSGLTIRLHCLKRSKGRAGLVRALLLLLLYWQAHECAGCCCWLYNKKIFKICKGSLGWLAALLIFVMLIFVIFERSLLALIVPVGALLLRSTAAEARIISAPLLTGTNSASWLIFERSRSAPTGTISASKLRSKISVLLLLLRSTAAEARISQLALLVPVRAPLLRSTAAAAAEEARTNF